MDGAHEKEVYMGVKELHEGTGKAGTAVKEGVINSLRGLDEIEAEIVSLVRNTLSNALRTTGAVADESLSVTRDVGAP